MKINKEEILDFLNKSDLHDIVVEQIVLNFDLKKLTLELELYNEETKVIYHGGLNLLMYTPLILMILVNMNSMLLNSLVFIVIKQIKTNFTQNLNLLETQIKHYGNLN